MRLFKTISRKIKDKITNDKLRRQANSSNRVQYYLDKQERFKNNLE